MATDIARISYDPARRYIDTVPQQGRVSLEAEENEQHAIDDVERLKELLDIIGPAGTPDSGYAVSYNGAGSPQIGPGVMYVGGLRVENDAPFMYDAQPDWVDCVGDPAYTASVGDGTVKEHVVLVLTDIDVTATEDPVLREAALGGPDGAARRRILQRVYCIKTTADDCEGALRSDREVWAADGQTFDPKTMRLNSNSRLLVTWDGPPPKPDPCEPTVAGGYLGADNQAIRVQICAVDATAGTFDFVWGWDNASSLYRVTADASAKPVLTLDRAPVDSYHNPQSGQPVEVLRSAAQLSSTDGVVEGYAASLTGQVAVLTAPYDPDLKQITFPATLPTQYTDTADTPQLYLRVWQELHKGVTPGSAVTLTGTGIQVTISAPEFELYAPSSGTPVAGKAAGRKPASGNRSGIVHLGDYWTIGVRPSTPNTVLPDRLLRTPQPPDGPRMWACPLAVISWRGEKFTVLADCRVPFTPLTGITADGGGCCTVAVKPSDAADLQKIIDQAAAGRTIGDVTQRITVCLSPGRYELAAPLRLTETHSQMHVEGCGDGAVLAAQAGQDTAFGDGLITLVDVRDTRISGITFEPPPTDTGIGRSRKAAATSDMRSIDSKITTLHKDLRVAIALRPIACTGLEIDDCVFSLAPNLPVRSRQGDQGSQSGQGSQSTGSADTTTTDSDSGIDPEATTQLVLLNQLYLAVGIFLGGTNEGVSVTRCRFTGSASTTSSTTTGTSGRFTTSNFAETMTFGILAAPTLVRAGATGSGTGSTSTVGTKSSAAVGSRVIAELEALRVADSSFTSLSAAGLSFAALGGAQVEDNTVRKCYIGFCFLSLDLPTYLDLTGSYDATGVDQSTMDGYNGAVTSLVLDPTMLMGYVFGRTYPLPASYQPVSDAQTGTQTSTQTSTQTGTQSEWTTQFVNRLTKGNYVARLALARTPTTSTNTTTPQQPAATPPPLPYPDEPTQAEWRPGAVVYPPPAQSADQEETSTVSFGTGAATRADVISGGGSNNSTVRAAALSVVDYELVLPYPITTAIPKLRFHGNRIECAQQDVYSDTGVAAGYARTGPALVIWAQNTLGGDQTGALSYVEPSVLGFSSALVDANEMIANGTGPVALIVLVNVVTMTGNHVLRQDRDQASVAVLGVDMAAAITGNVLFGNPLLPTNRPFASPLDTWLPLNTVVY